jgi:hypothetical protein
MANLDISDSINTFLQLESVEYFKYLGSMIPKDARCTRKIQSRIAMAKAAFSKEKTFFTNKSGLNLRKELEKYYILNMACYGVGTWTFRKVVQKYVKSFEF